MSSEPIEIPNELEQPRPGAFEALKNAVYARYVGTMSISMIGMWIRITAMGYLVYEITEDPFKLGMVSFAQGAPQLVMAPIAGAFLDRWDRKRVLITVQILQISLMIFLTWLLVTDRVAYGWLLFIGASIGATAAFDWPARSALVPRLVGRRALPSAIALSAASFNGARVIGPTVAGWLIALVGLSLAFGMTALTPLPFLIVLLTLPSLRPPPQDPDAPVVPPFRMLVDGYRYIWHDAPIRTMISVDIFPIILGMSYIAMTPALARDVLHLGPEGLGALLTANGIGALTGTALAARLNSMRNRGRLVLGFITAFAVMLIAFGLSSTLVFSLIAILLLGAGFATASILNDTLIQLNVEEAYRGRVVAVYSMVWGLSPAGGLLAGALANVIGLQWALAVNGLLVLLYVGWLWLRTPMRQID